MLSFWRFAEKEYKAQSDPEEVSSTSKTEPTEEIKGIVTEAKTLEIQPVELSEHCDKNGAATTTSIDDDDDLLIVLSWVWVANFLSQDEFVQELKIQNFNVSEK